MIKWPSISFGPVNLWSMPRMETTQSDQLLRINEMPAKVRDDVLWLTGQYRKLDKEHMALREEVLRIASSLETYAIRENNRPVLSSANYLRSLIIEDCEEDTV